MALTITRRGEKGGIPMTRGWREHTFELNITSYTTGGEVFTAASLGLSKLRAAAKPVSLDTTKGLGRELIWDEPGGKLFGYVTSTGAQIANATDIGKWVVRVVGR